MTTAQPSDRPLPDPRDAVAELARLVFDTTTMNGMLQRVADLAAELIPGVAEASVTLVIDDKPGTAACTGRLALDLDESQYGRGHGSPRGRR